MPPLRQACRNCSVAKRKCVVQLPSCTRCAEKGLQCVYDLDHLNAPRGNLAQVDELYHSLTVCNEQGWCLIDTLKSRAPGCDPAINDTPAPKPSTANLIRLGFQTAQSLLRAGHPAIFIHPKLHRHSSHRVHLDLLEKGDDGVCFDNFQHLVQIDIKGRPVQEALSALQALLIYLGTFLVSESDVERTSAEKSLRVLNEWTQNLLQHAQTSASVEGSAWQDWLFGESVRRTIVMSYALYMSITSYRRGYCANWLFLESLPFDRRPGLWIAQSAQAWMAAARVKTGTEVGEVLSSFHEFAVAMDGPDHTFCGDVFMSIVVYTHNGARMSGKGKPRELSHLRYQ